MTLVEPDTERETTTAAASQPPAPSRQSQLFKAAGLVAVLFLLSRVAGLVRDAVIAYYYGTESVEAIAFVTAGRFPDTIFYIVAGGALGSAFIPTFTGYLAREDTAGGWRLFSAITNLVMVLTTLVSLLTAIFAKPIVIFFLQELMAEEPALLPVTVNLLRVMLLSPIIFGVSGVVMGALNARQHFLWPAVAPIIYNLGIIAGAVIFAPNVMGLAIGTVAGAAGHLLIQLPGLRRQEARYTAVFSVRDPGVKQVLRLMAPRVLGLSFGQLNHLVAQYLAQSLVLGAIPALAYAWRIMIMPQGILGQALGIAAFPTFAILAAEKKRAEMRRILADSLRLIAFIGIPASLLLMILRRPLVALLFERGNFDEEATALVASALLFYMPGLVGLATLEIVARAFYALEDTRTPVLAGALQLAAMAGLSLWFSQVLFPRLGLSGVGGLAFGYTLATFLETGLLLWWLRRKMGGLHSRHLWDGLWRMGVAGVGAASAAWGALSVLGAAGSLWQVIVGGTAGGTAYLGLCLACQVSEATQVMAYLGTKRNGVS